MPTRWYNGIVQKPTYQRRIYAMSIIAQNSDKEVAIQSYQLQGAREPSLVPKFLTIPTCDTKKAFAF